jgi:hypothetical protein
LVLANSANAQSPVPAPSAPFAPRIELRNDADLAGWRFINKPGKTGAGCVLHEGVITPTAVGYLRTIKKFSNYYLHVEWRWPAKVGNSGVLVHINGDDAVWPNCVQCQIKGDATGDLLGMKGFDFGKPLVNGNQLAKRTGPPAEKPVGEWNTYDIVCRADTIELRVNGVLQNHLEKLPATTGFVALQMEGPPVEFRHVWLQPLSISAVQPTSP